MENMDTESDSDTGWENNSFAKRTIRSPVLRTKSPRNESNMDLNLEKSSLSEHVSPIHRDSHSRLPQGFTISAGVNGSKGRKNDENRQFHEQLPSTETLHPRVMELNERNAAHQDSDPTLKSESESSLIECLILHRLPGEKLGMILGIVGDKENNDKVSAVRVRSVTMGGAAERASGGSRGVGVGDQILEINGLDLHTLTYDECVSVFREMPLQVFMLVKRGKNVRQGFFENEGSMKDIEGILSSPPKGFTLHTVTITKKRMEPLGLSIVPSYGTTKHFYQVKRLLASGPSAKNCHLCVGDRLLSCNNTSLQNLVQSECMSILKQPNENVTFKILRPANSGQRLRISVNKSNRKDISWYSSGLDSTPDTTDSDTEGSLPTSEDDQSGPHRESSENQHQPKVSEVFSNRQFKIAYTQPALTSHITAISDTSTGANRPTSRRDILHFHPHGLPKSLKMEDSSGEKQDRTDPINLCSSDMDWLDSLGTGKSSEQVTVETSVTVTSQTVQNTNGTAPLLDFGDDLVSLEPQTSKQPTGVAHVPPPVEFADTSNLVSSGTTNQNGYRDIWESGLCETEFISEADNDVPVTNIDDLLGKSNVSNQDANPSETDSDLFSMATESSASENLLDFERMQSTMVSSERMFYQPPQETMGGYKQGSHLGDILGTSAESEMENILDGRMAVAIDRDEEERLSTFSSHSGSTVIHRTGSAFEEIEDGSKDLTPEVSSESPTANTNSELEPVQGIAAPQVTTVYVESNIQEAQSNTDPSQPQDMTHSSSGYVSEVTEETISVSVSKRESSAPVGHSSESGDIISVKFGESETFRKSPVPNEPCLVEEHIVESQQSQQTEAVLEQFSDSGKGYSTAEEDEISPVYSSRDVVINLEGTTDVEVQPRLNPDKTVLPEFAASLVEICYADDRKADSREEVNMAVRVEEETIIPSDKAQTLNAEMFSHSKHTRAEESILPQNSPGKEQAAEHLQVTTQVPTCREQGVVVESQVTAELSALNERSSAATTNQQDHSEEIVPVKAPRRSPPTSSPAEERKCEHQNKEAFPHLVDSMVQHLDACEKNSTFVTAEPTSTSEVVQEENIIASEVSREFASYPYNVESERNDCQKLKAPDKNKAVMTFGMEDELVISSSGQEDSVSNAHVSSCDEDKKHSWMENKISETNSLIDTQKCVQELNSETLLFSAEAPALNKQLSKEDSVQEECRSPVGHPTNTRKSKLEDPDVIVPVKVPRRSPDAGSPVDGLEGNQQKQDALPQLVDSMVYHLVSSEKSPSEKFSGQNGLIIEEESIVPTETSRESASFSIDTRFETQSQKQNDPIADNSETVIQINAQQGFTESDKKTNLLKMNGHFDEFPDSQSPEHKNISASTCQDGSTEMVLQENIQRVNAESKEEPQSCDNKLLDKPSHQVEDKEIIPVKAPRRHPAIENTSNNEEQNTERRNSQPFVDLLVANLDSNDKAFQTKLEITEPGDLAKEDNIISVDKSVQSKAVEMAIQPETTTTEVHHVSSETKTTALSDGTPVKVDRIESSTTITTEAAPPPAPKLSPSTVEPKPDNQQPEHLKTSSSNFGESSFQPPKEESLLSSNLTTTTTSRHSVTLPPALAPVAVPDQPVTRRLPSIKAFTAKGFTPVKLNSLGTSSVIKTVSLDRSKFNRLSSANIQTPSAPAMKLAAVNSRSESGPFQIDLLSGILGLGLKVTRKPDGFYQVSDIQRNSPVEKSGHIRVRDYLLCVNGTYITGLPDTKVQQILRLLPRGIIKLVISANPVEKENMEQATSAASDGGSVKSQGRLGEAEKTPDQQPEQVQVVSSKVDSMPRVSAVRGPLANDGINTATVHTSTIMPAMQEPAVNIQSSVPLKNTMKDTSESSVVTEGTFSIRKIEIVDNERDSASPNNVTGTGSSLLKPTPPPVMPRRRGKPSEDLNLNVDLARKEAVRQESKEQDSDGSVAVKAYPVMVRPSVSPRTSVPSPKGPPPPVSPRMRSRSHTSEGESYKSALIDSNSPELSPRTEPKDVLDSNRKPSSVAKHYGTVKSPMSRKMSGLIDRFQHEETSPVSPESDKVFSPRMNFETHASTSSTFSEPRKHFSFSVSEEVKTDAKTNVTPKSPPKVAPKPKRRSGEITYNHNLSDSISPKDQPVSTDIQIQKQESSFSQTSKVEKRDDGGVKLTTRPHSVETVFNTRSLISSSSVTRLKGLQIPSKSAETTDVNEPSSTLLVNPSKLAPALRPRSGPAAFTRVQPKIQQVSPKLNLMPIRLRTEDSDSKSVNQEGSPQTGHLQPEKLNKTSGSTVTTNVAEIPAEPHTFRQTESTGAEEISSKETEKKTTFSVTSSVTGPYSTAQTLEKPIDLSDSTEAKKVDTAVTLKDEEESVSSVTDSDVSEAPVSVTSTGISTQDDLCGNDFPSASIATESLASASQPESASKDTTVQYENIAREDESKNNYQVTQGKTGNEMNEPVFEKFAESVSSSVLDSSIVTASGLISNDKQTVEKSDDFVQNGTEVVKHEDIDLVLSQPTSDSNSSNVIDSQSFATVSVMVDTPNLLGEETKGMSEMTQTSAVVVSSHPSTAEEPNVEQNLVGIDANEITLSNTKTMTDYVSHESSDHATQSEPLVLNNGLGIISLEVENQTDLLQSSNELTEKPGSQETLGGQEDDLVTLSTTTDTQTPEAIEDDSDVPPVLPSSPPPPLPASPPPDSITSSGNQLPPAQPPKDTSPKPIPPIALRRHQEVQHSTLRQPEFPRTVEVVEGSAPQEVATSDSITKDQPTISNDIFELPNQGNLSQTTLSPSSTNTTPYLERSPEGSSSVTEQNTDTIIPDINSSLNTEVTKVTVSSDDPFPQVLAQDSTSTQSTTTTTRVTTTTRRKVTLISNKDDKANPSSTSDTSFLPSGELEFLLNQANDVLEKTGATDDEIMVILLHKDIGEKVGLSLKSGPKKEILISDVEENSTAGKNGHIVIGDQLLLVNGRTVEHRSPHEVRVMLRTSREKLILVLARPTAEVREGRMQESQKLTVEAGTRSSRLGTGRERIDSGSSDTGSLRRTSPEKSISPSLDTSSTRSRSQRSSLSPEKDTPAEVSRDPSTMETFEVTMSKGVTGLGFCLEGGTGSPLGDKPILIKRLFKGGAADKCGLLQEKDEILEVNGKSFQGLRHYEAWNYLKFLPSGDVKLVIRR